MALPHPTSTPPSMRGTSPGRYCRAGFIGLQRLFVVQ